MTPTRPTYATKFGFATDDNNTQQVDITPTEHANTPAATVAAVAPTAVVKYQCDIPVDPGSCDNWEIRW